MTIGEHLASKIQDCENAPSDFVTGNPDSSTSRWNALKAHAVECRQCQDALLEYEFISGATMFRKPLLSKETHEARKHTSRGS